MVHTRYITNKKRMARIIGKYRFAKFSLATLMRSTRARFSAGVSFFALPRSVFAMYVVRFFSSSFLSNKNLENLENLQYGIQYVKINGLNAINANKI